MAIEPLGSKFNGSQKAPVSKKDAGALAHTEGGADGPVAAEKKQSIADKKASTDAVANKADIQGQTLVKQDKIQGVEHDAGHAQMAGKTENGHPASTGFHAGSLNGAEAAAEKAGFFSLTNAFARAEHVLEALALPVTEASRRAVLVAMAEGLKLTPKLIRRIMQFMEEHPDEDVQSCVQALADDDAGLLGQVLALLGSLGASGDRPRDRAEAGELPEAEEKDAIKVQAKQLFLGWLQDGGAEELASYREPGFTWIQLPFSFSQGALDLTGYIRMLYTYSEHAVTRVVLDCENDAGRRLAVFEQKRSVFWSPVRSETESISACGMVISKSAEEAEASALCGIDSVYRE